MSVALLINQFGIALGAGGVLLNGFGPRAVPAAAAVVAGIAALMLPGTRRGRPCAPRPRHPIRPKPA